ncbi:hypothetical protein CFT13S00388_07940 [Campylobacter fetus subsp. testudinum]|uniref:hypothetical protein n=1 Tax=Campylobacter fetus TaxID=196 RepID=UPI0008188A5C|nr:hypothetical protein [Campylobacter fetus]OCR86678.1 hypothetical protein CFT13S00388_07940 [Campylobacter fetus subsp. testudinum]
MAGNQTSNFEILKDGINVNFIRKISNLNDNAIKILLSVYICELIGGLKQMPTKLHKIELAKELIKTNYNQNKILDLCNISQSTYFKLKKEIKK